MRTGYIYKIWCRDVNVKDHYIGSTMDMKNRKSTHKGSCNNTNDRSYNSNVYQFIRNTGGWTNWRMDLIEELQFNTRAELNRREGEIIKSTGATLNKNTAGRTHDEYYQANKDMISEKGKQHYEEHKDERKQYYEEHKEDAKKYHEENRDYILNRKKKWYRANRDERLLKSKLYNEAHTEQIRARREANKEDTRIKFKEYYEKNEHRRRERIECLCGKSYQKKRRSDHFKSKRHIKLYENGLYEYINS